MPTAAYLASVITPLLRHPADLHVAESKDDMGILLSVDVHKEDMGVVVGKGGETAKAVRHLVRIVGLKSSARVSVKINEPAGEITQ
jgi:predicted RNA-binding protein YlqC (UPF0109 family)